MSRLVITSLAILLALSAVFVDADQTIADVPLPAAVDRHSGEIEAKRANMERALTLHQPDPKNWAPVPDPLALQ